MAITIGRWDLVTDVYSVNEVLKDPAPDVLVLELAESTLTLPDLKVRGF
jgi:hypothetical protein